MFYFTCLLVNACRQKLKVGNPLKFYLITINNIIPKKKIIHTNLSGVNFYWFLLQIVLYLFLIVVNLRETGIEYLGSSLLDAWDYG